MSDPEVGDWVQVYAQRVATPYSSEHPEDWVVKMQSHSDDYLAHVRRDRVVKCDPPPDIAMRCNHLWEQPEEHGYRLLRCTRHYDHGGEHEATFDGKIGHWTSRETAGYFEERS
jgi:hypothetical protein